MRCRSHLQLREVPARVVPHPQRNWPRLRLIAPWVGFSVTAVLFVFFVPFFGLLSRAAKVFRPTLALFTIIFNLIVDILYAFVDPRVRYD